MSRSTRPRPRVLAPALIALLVLFVATRLLLHGAVTPFFAHDSYKYLGGADSLWHTGVLAPVFRDLLRTGAALHVVPGYAFLLEGVWTLAGRVVVDGATLVHAAASLAAFAMAGQLAAAWLGRRVGIVLFVVLTLSPTIAWLERTLMPDILAPAIVLAGCWLADRLAPRRDHPLRHQLGRTAAGAALAGALAGFGVLLRASSLIFVPFPALVALCRGRDRRGALLWLAVYAAVAVLPLAPWALHNHEQHGVYRVSVSTGRNLFFSALWGPSERGVRERVAREVRLPPAVQPSPYNLSDRVFAGLVAQGRSVPEADAAMGRMALAIHRENGPGHVLRQRLACLLDLFRARPLPAPGRNAMTDRPPPRLFDAFDWEAKRSWAEKRFGHAFSPELDAAVKESRHHSLRAGAAFALWLGALRGDGLLLLGLYLLCAPLLFLAGPPRWPLFWTFAAPPLAFLAAFALMGAPLYRYQVGLHPFLLATIVCGAAVGLRRLRRAVV